MRTLRWASSGLLAVVATALALWSVTAAAASPDDALGTAAPAALVLQASAVIVLAGAGAWAAGSERARTSGWCLVAASAATPFVVAPAQGVGGPVPFTAGLVAAGLPGLLAALAGAAWPTSVSTRAARAVMVVAVVVGGTGAVLPGLTFDPLAEGCTDCPRNLLLVPGLAGAYPAARTLRDVAVLSAAAALAVVIAVQWWGSPPLFRRLAAPVVVPTGAAAVATAGGAAHRLTLPFGGFDATSTAWWLALCGLLLVTGAGVAVVAASIGRAAGDVGGLVLSVAPEPEALRSGLVRSIGDPQLTVAFPRADGSLVDHDGNDLPGERGDRQVITVTRRGVVVAQVRFAPRFAGAGRLLRPAVEAAGLGLEHAAARARLRAEAREVAESTARLVAAGDTERRRVERNLHDGAQQQLIALALTVRAAEKQAADGDRVALAAAGRELRTALDELRALARGIFPVALHDAGLLAALDELADHSHVPLDVAGELPVEPPVAVAMAAYRVVADLVDAAAALPERGRVVVTLEQTPQRLHVDVLASGATAGTVVPRLLHATDRVRALGGQVDVHDEAEPPRLRLVAVLPFP